jgi:hypothetical protein
MSTLLHLDYRPLGGYWILRLMSRLQGSSSPTLKLRVDQWAASGLGGLAGAVATKEAMHQLIVSRLNGRLARLAELLKLDPVGVEECRRSGHAYSLKDKTLAYDLLIDTDAFLFETLSTFEITRRFVAQFFACMLGRQLTPETATNALTERGADVRWIKILKDERNIFIHETAPWPAIRIGEGGRFDLVLLKKNVLTLKDTADYTMLADYSGVYSGFVNSLGVIEAWLADEVAAFEAAAPR